MCRFYAAVEPGAAIPEACDSGEAFSPGEPTVPADPEALRLWDFPVGINTIYKPRS